MRLMGNTWGVLAKEGENDCFMQRINEARYGLESH